MNLKKPGQPIRSRRESCDLSQSDLVILDLDETLMVEHASVEAAFEEACGPAVAKHGVNATELSEACRRRGRELWRASPVHPWCRKIGISSWEGLSGDFSGDGAELVALRQWMTESRFRVAAWQRALADLGVEDEPLARELAEHLVGVRKSYHVLYPEAESVLEALGRERRLALLTNGAPRIQREKIESVGLEEHFEAIIVSGEVGVGKPDPRVFEITLKRLGTTAAAAVMIGDSLRSDIAGANAAGIRSIWLNRFGAPPIEAIEPDHEIADLRELPDILG